MAAKKASKKAPAKKATAKPTVAQAYKSAAKATKSLKPSSQVRPPMPPPGDDSTGMVLGKPKKIGLGTQLTQKKLNKLEDDYSLDILLSNPPRYVARLRPLDYQGGRNRNGKRKRTGK